jgi:cytosine/adenosine deaminase-related metal-dependent hydrolase
MSSFRKIQPTRLFDGYATRPPGSVLVLAQDGTVAAILPPGDAGGDIEAVAGLLCPGFVNAHCHLELSHLKGLVPPGTGLVEFLVQVVTKRDTVCVDIQESIRQAEAFMEAAGIVAVGDICNTTDSFPVKAQSRIAWTNFVEVLSFRDETAPERVRHYSEVRDLFRTLPETPYRGIAVARSSLVPHAPYSISPLSYRLIDEATAGEVISMHNQETPAEDELFLHGGGDFLRLYQQFGSSSSPNPVTGRSSLQSILPRFTRGQTLLLIHNTCTSEVDLRFALDYEQQHGIALYFCLCPNANLYIEQRMPPVEMLLHAGARIVLGTDSLSSNYQLSIAEEISTIRKQMPLIPLDMILSWATLGGAKALRRDDVLGSFEQGKKPGGVLLDDNFQPRKLF